MSKRPTHAVPDEVSAALRFGDVEGDYRARPPHQRNDYLGWIGRAKRDDTRRSRIAQMIAELKQGGIYMGMADAPNRKG